MIKYLKYRENGITVNGNRVTVRYVLKEGDTLRLSLEDTEFTRSYVTAGKIHTRQTQMVRIPLTHRQSAQMLTSEEKTYTSEMRLSAC